ncbi:MAG: tail fiber domain-containing protein [Bacteroidales bacterium]|nr:tail fiber domain-containing protein [Bacteroidales bacterium]
MKRLCIFSILLFGAVVSVGQIKVVNNKVAIGETWGQNPTHTLDVRGVAYFDCDTYAGISITHSTYANAGSTWELPTILPQFNSSARLGTPTAEFAQVFATEIYVRDGVFVVSDAKTKQNIRPMDMSLDKIKQLKLVKFDYKEDYFMQNLDTNTPLALKNAFKASLKNKNGFLAQDVETIYPNLIKYNGEADLKVVNYIGFIPELTKAIQELSEEVEALKAEITYLKANCCNVESKSNVEETTAKLYQNTPNPFNYDTRIDYYVPLSAKSAALFVYDLNGKQMKHVPIVNKGQSSCIITANDLEAGMYIYTLLVDNSIVDTKKMILTK